MSVVWLPYGFFWAVVVVVVATAAAITFVVMCGEMSKKNWMIEWVNEREGARDGDMEAHRVSGMERRLFVLVTWVITTRFLLKCHWLSKMLHLHDIYGSIYKYEIHVFNVRSHSNGISIRRNGPTRMKSVNTNSWNDVSFAHSILTITFIVQCFILLCLFLLHLFFFKASLHFGVYVYFWWFCVIWFVSCSNIINRLNIEKLLSVVWFFVVVMAQWWSRTLIWRWRVFVHVISEEGGGAGCRN